MIDTDDRAGITVSRVGRVVWARSGATGDWFKYLMHRPDVGRVGQRSKRACEWIDDIVNRYRGKSRAENIRMSSACKVLKGRLEW